MTKPPMKKYVVRPGDALFGTEIGPSTEDEIEELCLEGKIGKAATFADYRGVGISGSFRSIESEQRFASAIARFQQGLELKQQGVAQEKKRREAEFNPSPSALLYIRPGEGSDPKGPYTAGQIRTLWNSGQIFANSQFKHPDYDEWFPVGSLVLTKQVGKQPVGKQDVGELLQAVINLQQQQSDQLSGLRWTVVGFGLVITIPILMARCGAH